MVEVVDSWLRPWHDNKRRKWQNERGRCLSVTLSHGFNGGPNTMFFCFTNCYVSKLEGLTRYMRTPECCTQPTLGNRKLHILLMRPS